MPTDTHCGHSKQLIDYHTQVSQEKLVPLLPCYSSPAVWQSKCNPPRPPPPPPPPRGDSSSSLALDAAEETLSGSLNKVGDNAAMLRFKVQHNLLMLSDSG